MDGLPLIGPLGVRQLTAQQQPDRTQVNLSWRTETPTGKPVQIYRDGQPIARLTDHEHSYVDNDIQALKGPINYTLVFNGVPVSRLVTLQEQKSTP